MQGNLKSIGPWLKRFDWLVIPFALSVVLITLLGMSTISQRIGLIDESVRQYFWFFGAEHKLDASLNISVLDLYTSETYNPSPKLYRQRLDSYELEESLLLYCDLGVKVIAIDFYIDQDTWVGKVLLANKEASHALRSSLSCFERVWLLVREDAGRWVLPVEPLQSLPNVAYAHAQTLESLLYPSSLTADVGKGQMQVPYLAQALAGMKPEPSRESYFPLRFDSLPTSFPRMRFEDLEVFNTLKPVYSPEKLKEFYALYYSIGDLPKPLPEAVIVTFTRDPSDSHDVAFNFGGELNLDAHSDQQFVDFQNSSGDESTLKYGQESPLYGTPGAYIVASETNALVEKGEPLVARDHRYLFLFSFVVAGIFAFRLASRVQSSLQLVGVYSSALLLYLSIMTAVMTTTSLLLPISEPIFFIVLLWLFSELRFAKQIDGIFDRLLSRQSVANQRDLDEISPYVIKLAMVDRDSQIDPYKRLLASIDLLGFWIQHLCLLVVAEYVYRDGNDIKTLPGNGWKSFKRPTLGNYLYILKNVVGEFGSLKEASEKSWFPELYKLLNERNSRLEEELQQILKLRNEWKHFSSTNYSESIVNEAQREVDDLESSLRSKLSFLMRYDFVQPKRLRSSKNGVHYWDCLIYKVGLTHIEEVATANELQPDTLYLFNNQAWGNYDNTLLLEPWIAAGECCLHHRFELFYYVGVEYDRVAKGHTDHPRYSGLTEGCMPSNGGV